MFGFMERRLVVLVAAAWKDFPRSLGIRIEWGIGRFPTKDSRLYLVGVKKLGLRRVNHSSEVCGPVFLFLGGNGLRFWGRYLPTLMTGRMNPGK